MSREANWDSRIDSFISAKIKTVKPEIRINKLSLFENKDIILKNNT